MNNIYKTYGFIAKYLSRNLNLVLPPSTQHDQEDQDEKLRQTFKQEKSTLAWKTPKAPQNQERNTKQT